MNSDIDRYGWDVDGPTNLSGENTDIDFVESFNFATVSWHVNVLFEIDAILIFLAELS